MKHLKNTNEPIHSIQAELGQAWLRLRADGSERQSLISCLSHCAGASEFVDVTPAAQRIMETLVEEPINDYTTIQSPQDICRQYRVAIRIAESMNPRRSQLKPYVMALKKKVETLDSIDQVPWIR